MGGAIACDVHGKNHHRDGSFCRHVRSIELWTPSRGALTLTPEDHPEEFRATAGGMGLTGVILAATIVLRPVRTAHMRVDVERAANLDDALDRMSRGDDGYEYSVAWIDCLARGGTLAARSCCAATTQSRTTFPRSSGRAAAAARGPAARRAALGAGRPAAAHHRPGVQRLVVPPGSRRPWHARAGRAVLLPARLGGGLESSLRAARARPVPARAAVRCGGRAAGGARAVSAPAAPRLSSRCSSASARGRSCCRSRSPGWTLALDVPAERSGTRWPARRAR